MHVFYDKDYDLSIIQGKKVAIIGYGSQDHAHICSPEDSDVDVTVGLRSGPATVAKAEVHGLKAVDVKTVVAAADVVMTLTPDEFQGRLYKEEIEPDLRKGVTLTFAHGLSIHYNQAVPRADLGVIMIVPEAPGRTVRPGFVKDGGIPDLITIYQDASDNAKNAALSYAHSVGGGRTGIIETIFKDETEADLFGEQAVLYGGCVELVKADFETPVEADYVPGMACFECPYELKLIVDLMYEGGIADTNYSIPNNAEYGEYAAGPEVINAEPHAVIRNALKRIQDGEYAKMFITEGVANYPSMATYRCNNAAHPIEQIGEELRTIMPWITANRIVDKSKN